MTTTAASSPAAPAEVVAWLMAGDPAIRWQVLRDLLDAGDDAVAAERALVATRGWGARLLALQDGDGRWGGGLYSPKWISTTYTLLLLHWLGLPPGHPATLRGNRLLWDGASFTDGGLTLAKTIRYPEACITSMLVLLAASSGYHDPRLPAAVSWLLGQQLRDGGWNCLTVVTGSHHGSFHTSINVLDALTAYRDAGGPIPVDRALRQGQEFFLEHRLYRSHRTGAVVDPAMTRFPFPPQWHHDVLRGLEHFRAAGASRDPRLADAVEQVRRRQGRGAGVTPGTWPRYRPYAGTMWFALEEKGRSRWATMRALRVLRWWDRT